MSEPWGVRAVRARGFRLAVLCVSPLLLCAAKALQNGSEPKAIHVVIDHSGADAVQDHSDKAAAARRSDAELQLQRDATAAAERGLWIAVASAVLSLVSAGGLIWTLIETRRTSRRQLRAYVSVRPANLTVHDRGANGMEVSLKIKNGGETPAYDCVHSGNIYALAPSKAEAFFSIQNEAPRIGERAAYVLHSTQDTDGAIRSHEGFTSETMTAVKDGTRILYAYGSIEYVDIFSVNRQSLFCYKIPPQVIIDAERDVIGKKVAIGPMEWELAPFHNTAS